MTNKEFGELTNLITDNRLFELNNTYGFNETDNTNDPLEGVIYRLNYTEGDSSKYLLIHPNLANSYPENLSRLIYFLSNYCSAHLKK